MRARTTLAALALTAAACAAAPTGASAYEVCTAPAFEGQPEICFGGSRCDDRHPALTPVYTLQEKLGGGERICPM